ncbi:MBL fold metallo-hydrolase [Streptomyces sp. 900105755]
MRAQDTEPAQPVRAIGLSHLHHDHTGALSDLLDVPVHVSREHWEAYRSHLRAEAEAVVPRHWPRDFAPRFLEPTGPAAGPWPHTYPVTADGRVFAVDTPGHMTGHISLVVRGDEVTYLLTGDAAYTLDELDAEVPDGFSADPRAAVESLRKTRNSPARRMLWCCPATIRGPPPGSRTPRSTDPRRIRGRRPDEPQSAGAGGHASAARIPST